MVSRTVSWLHNRKLRAGKQAVVMVVVCVSPRYAFCGYSVAWTVRRDKTRSLYQNINGMKGRIYPRKVIFVCIFSVFFSPVLDDRLYRRVDNMMREGLIQELEEFHRMHGSAK